MKHLRNSKFGFGAVEIILVVVLLALVGYVGYSVMNSSDDETSSASALTIPDSLDGLKSFSEISLLAADVSSAQVISIELDSEDDALVYKVKLGDGVVLVFDSETGALLSSDSGEAFEVDDAIPVDFVAGITVDAAIATAKADHPGVAVDEVELEMEDGVAVFSVRFVDDTRVDVDALTGLIVDVRSGDDEDNDEDDDGIENEDDDDDDNDGIDDSEDLDDDNDGIEDSDDHDDDNDGVDDDDELEDHDELDEEDDEEEDDEEDNSGPGSN